MTAVLGAWAIWLVGAGAARATIVASDTFTAADGTVLNGRTNEIGGLTWSSTLGTGGNPILITNGYVSVKATSSGPQATVPFVTTGTRDFTISADLNPNTATIDWLAIGFMPAASGFIESNGLLWGLLRGGVYTSGSYSDNWNLFINGTATSIAHGVAVASSNSFNDVKLSYDVSSTVVTYTINGVNVFQGAVAGINLGGITRAGFQGENPPLAQVDNFLLEATIPEPGTVALLGLGGLLLGRRRK